MQVYRSDIGQQRDRPRALDSVCQRPLMLCTTTGYPSGNNFAALGDKMLERFRVLIIDDQTGIRTKAADLAPVIDTFFPLWPSSGSALIGNHFI